MASLNTPFVAIYKDGKLQNDFSFYPSKYPNRRMRRYNPRRQNNRISGGYYVQPVYSSKDPNKIFIGRYITKHMADKCEAMGLSKKEALEQYGKNRYIFNPNAKPVKFIKHKLIRE